MLNNDTLRRVRFIVDLSDPKMLTLIGTGGREVSRESLRDFMKKENDEGMQPCPDDVLAAFLNGLIVERRGPRDIQPSPEERLDNNRILKKLRVAFNLRDQDVQLLLKTGGVELTRSELNALFRNPNHKNYKPCGDQVLRQFIAGLTRQYRPDQAE